MLSPIWSRHLAIGRLHCLLSTNSTRLRLRWTGCILELLQLRNVLSHNCRALAGRSCPLYKSGPFLGGRQYMFSWTGRDTRRRGSRMAVHKCAHVIAFGQWKFRLLSLTTASSGSTPLSSRRSMKSRTMSTNLASGSLTRIRNYPCLLLARWLRCTALRAGRPLC